MDRVAERVEDRPEVGVDVVVVDPDIGRRDDDVVGEGAVTVDADTDGVDAQVATPRAAVATGAADDVALAGDPVADPHARHVATDLVDLAVELVADGLGRARHRTGGPVVPAVQVQVGPAQAGTQDPDADLVVTGVGLRDVGQLEAWASAGFDQCAHLLSCRRVVRGDRGHDPRPELPSGRITTRDEGETSPWSGRSRAPTVEAP